MGDGDLRSAFDERGYLGPVRLFGEQECQAILARLCGEQRPPMDWDKGRAATSPDYHRLATHDAILDLVTRLLGDDVLLWGASLLRRAPGEPHPWHTDIESSSADGETLAVWIGLANTDSRSSLKLVPFSHRFGAPLQRIARQNGAGRGDLTDDLVARLAAERDARSGVVQLESADGDAVLFDGRLWHGSHNLNPRHTRYAALLQYATPRAPIRIPNLSRLEWPFESYRTPAAPCVVVSGHDVEGRNRLVAAPAVSARPGMPALTTRVHSLRLPLEQDPEVGWKPHPLFRGATPNLKDIGCHASVLDPGRQPHPPHRHDEEEILVVLDGEATLVLDESRQRARRGTFAYYPAGFAHTIRNDSVAPISYVMLKWQTDSEQKDGLLEHRLVPRGESPGAGSDGFSAIDLLAGETRCLRQLHSHLTTLRPGAGYEPHVDAHDVAIVVLEGTVETLGERVGPDSVIFYAAGEPHGMRNAGDVPATYLVFEFHGRHLPHRAGSPRRTATGAARSLLEAARRRLSR